MLKKSEPETSIHNPTTAKEIIVAVIEIFLFTGSVPDIYSQ
jgi:hypothetical protein